MNRYLSSTIVAVMTTGLVATSTACGNTAPAPAPAPAPIIATADDDADCDDEDALDYEAPDCGDYDVFGVFYPNILFLQAQERLSRQGKWKPVSVKQTKPGKPAQPAKAPAKPAPAPKPVPAKAPAPAPAKPAPAPAPKVVAPAPAPVRVAPAPAPAPVRVSPPAKAGK